MDDVVDMLNHVFYMIEYGDIEGVIEGIAELIGVLLPLFIIAIVFINLSKAKKRKEKAVKAARGPQARGRRAEKPEIWEEYRKATSVDGSADPVAAMSAALTGHMLGDTASAHEDTAMAEDTRFDAQPFVVETVTEQGQTLDSYEGLAHTGLEYQGLVPQSAEGEIRGPGELAAKIPEVMLEVQRLSHGQHVASIGGVCVDIDRSALVQGVIYKEILDKPRSLRRISWR